MDHYSYHSPIGIITISADKNAVLAIDINKESPIDTHETPLIKKAYSEILEYLTQGRTTFTVPLNPQGTNYQKSVWNALRDIPYGSTNTYKEIAAVLGNDKASRAIGMACNRNPIMIMIPCHRVLGSNGDLTGYAGGLDIKKTLLSLEKSV